jgi:hypothetical protein
MCEAAFQVNGQQRTNQLQRRLLYLQGLPFEAGVDTLHLEHADRDGFHGAIIHGRKG